MVILNTLNDRRQLLDRCNIEPGKTAILKRNNVTLSEQRSGNPLSVQFA